MSTLQCKLGLISTFHLHIIMSDSGQQALHAQAPGPHQYGERFEPESDRLKFCSMDAALAMPPILGPESSPMLSHNPMGLSIPRPDDSQEMEMVPLVQVQLLRI